MVMDKDKAIRCCLCGKIIQGYSHNAEPLAKGVCCDECNIQVIIERRMELFDLIDKELI